ncbi:MAG: universal stress protein [Spirochaetia bacterium]|jgi:nucleotide-binding universal stress UspA family protein
MKSLIQTIVVAVSGSEASINAAKYGIVMARLYRLRLVGVYVVDTATLRELLLSKIFVEDESSEYEKSLEENGRRYLNYVQDLAAKKGVEMEKILRRGAISTEIVEAADEAGADLILLGGFEESKSIRDVVSRQRREIVRNSKCSVLVVKEPAIDLIYKRS